MIRSDIVEVNGTNLFVQDSAEENLPVVLGLHSLFLDVRMFEDFVEAAAGTFRVVQPDFRGQGRSDLDTVDMIHLDTVVDDVLELIEKLQLKDVNLLPQSMGGDVGFRLIARRPELFSRMVVLSSSARSEPADQLETFREFTDNIGKYGFIGENLETLMAIMFGETTRNDPAKTDLVELWRDRITAVPRRLRPAIGGVIERESVLDLLPQITIPVLIFSGQEDVARPPHWSEEVAERLPDAEVVRLEKVGHSPILEAPDIVLARVLEFFGDVETEPPEAAQQSTTKR